MCTLVLAWQVFEDAPVTIAANRDEATDRPAKPPDVYDRDPLVVAPRDVEAGGTWIGCNEHGLFAGITNRWTDATLAGERSRGLLVADVLDCDSVDEAERILESTTAAHEYEGFILVVADPNRAVCFAWDGELTRTRFGPGVHVVVNVGFDDTFEMPTERRHAGEQQAANAGRVRSVLEETTETTTRGETETREGSSAWLERAGRVLGDHEYGVCVHGDGYGTRSSSLIAIGDDSEYRSRDGLSNRIRYSFADGSPCRTPFEPVDLSALE